MRILVMGLPGSGKTTWAREHLGRGVCYDLDAIAGAFRLSEPKTHDTDGARRLANDLLWGFAQRADGYADPVIIIRTAPSVQDVLDIAPDRVVLCRLRTETKVSKAEQRRLRARIVETLTGLAAAGVEVEEAPLPSRGYPGDG